MSQRYYNFWSIFLVMHRFVKSFTFLVRNIPMMCFTRRIQVWIFKSAMFQRKREEDSSAQTFIHFGNITAIFIHAFMNVFNVFSI